MHPHRRPPAAVVGCARALSLLTCALLWCRRIRRPDYVNFYQNRQLLCEVRQTGFVADTYSVNILPHTDVLMYLAISCAIDRIHHEVLDDRRRYQRHAYYDPFQQDW